MWTSATFLITETACESEKELMFLIELLRLKHSAPNQRARTADKITTHFHIRYKHDILTITLVTTNARINPLTGFLYNIQLAC